jgi:hypothetical protein
VPQLDLLTIVPRLLIVLSNFFKPFSAEQLGTEIRITAEVEHCASRQVFA